MSVRLNKSPILLPKCGILVLLCVTTLAACKPKSTATSHDSGRFIAFVGVGRDDPIWPILAASARRTHAGIGFSAPPLRIEAPRNRSVNAQKALIERLRREGMMAVCLQITDPPAMNSLIDNLLQAGIRVVTLQKQVRSSMPVCHVGYDDEAIGDALARAAAVSIDHKGTINVLHADSTGRAQIHRHNAFLQRINAFPDVRILLEFDCHANQGEAERIIRETTSRYPRLSAWVLLDSWSIGRDAEHGGLNPNRPAVTVHPYPTFWPLIENGTLRAVIAPRYDLLAAEAIRICLTDLKNVNQVNVSRVVPCETIRKDNLDQYRQKWQHWSQP